MIQNPILSSIFKIALQLFVVVSLTLVSQVGGVVWLLVVLVGKIGPKPPRWLTRPKRKLLKFGLGILLYFLISFLLLPPIARHFGRERLPVVKGKIEPASWILVFCNRTYVQSDVKESLEKITDQIDTQNEFVLHYLDAGFPFAGIPLLPHLSHGDGRKIDFSFCYYDPQDQKIEDTPGWIGYGFYEPPFAHEKDQISLCEAKNPFYSFPGFIALPYFTHLKCEPKATTKCINIFANNNSVKKIFLEPHLKNRWHLNSNKIRFHGCRAVRHDDHFHVEF